MARAYVGVGSNIDREANVRSGIATLRESFGTLAISPVYRAPAVGFEGEDFYNLVVGFDTALDPHALTRELHAVEARHGRVRSAPRFSPRTLDLDLLLYDDLVLHEGEVQVPRADILEYDFVLRPLAELAGERVHPETGERLADLWARVGGRAALEPVDLALT